MCPDPFCQLPNDGHTHLKSYIEEPWPIGRCAVCGLNKEIRASAVRADGTEGLCCEDCFQQLPERGAA